MEKGETEEMMRRHSVNFLKKSFYITRLNPMSFKCCPIQPCLFLFFFKLSSAQLPVTARTAASIKTRRRRLLRRDEQRVLVTHTQTNVCRAKGWGCGYLGCAGRWGERKCLRGPWVHDSGQSSWGRPGSFVCSSCCHGNAHSPTSGRCQLLDFCV